MPCHLHGGRLALCYNICDAGGERRRHLATFLPDGSEQATWELPRDYWGSGILAYGDREIHISGGSYVVKVTGEGLELRAMTGMELLITGRIAGVELT